MNDQMTPREVWEKQHEYVRAFDAEGQASLFAEDAVWELPFAPEGIPKKITGRAQILAVSSAGMARSKASGRTIEGYHDVVVHETSDPEVIVAEFTLRGVTGEGETYNTPYIQVIQVRDGQIVRLRDYFPGEILKPHSS